MAGTVTKTVVLEIKATSEEAQAKIDDIRAKANELKRLNPEIAVKIDKSAAVAQMGVLREELKAAAKAKPIEPEVKPKPDIPEAVNAGRKAGDAAAGGFRIGFLPAAITGGIGLGLAALPALAAATGALMGGALAAKLLVGTQAVKGPLYSQFQGMLQSLVSVIRVAALPLVKPLGDAFAQIATWAKQMYPVLRDAFASIGPLIQPLVTGLESVISGLLPGFIALMRAAQPAVQAVAGLLGTLARTLGGLLAQLAPAVRASSLVLGSLGSVVRSLMPLVGTLARSLATLLTPVLHVLASSVVPALVGALRAVLVPATQLISTLANSLAPILPPLVSAIAAVGHALIGSVADSIRAVMPSLLGIIGTLTKMWQQVVQPFLPVLSQLAGMFIRINMMGVQPLIPPVLAVANALLGLADKVITPLVPLLDDLANALTTAANSASFLLSKLSMFAGIPGLGFLAGLGGGGGSAGIGAGLGQMVLGALQQSMPTGSAAYNAAVAALAPVLDGWGDGLTGTGSGSGVTKVKAKAANLGLILATGVQQALAGTAAQVRAAISKLLGAVSTDVAGGFISQHEGTVLTRFLERDSARLQTLANRRAHILAVIQAADKYAANIASTTQSSFGLVNAAAVGTGPWGGPASVGTIVGTLQAEVRRIRSFARDIAKLRKMGLNRAYIDQLIQAGPDQGGAIADELASSGIGEIRQINLAEHQIATASISLGRTAAEAMFDSGKQAGKGFLSGLEAQQKQIEAVMKKIAQVLVDTIKRELKMHSPSQLLRDLARDGAAGALALGLDDGRGLVQSAARRAALAMVPPRAGLGLAGAAGGVLRIQLEWVGGPADQALMTLLKNHVRIRGGDPGVFGR